VTTSAYLEDVRAAASRDGEPRWLRDLRARGAAYFAKVGFPTTRDEDWKYTSAAPIAELDVRALQEPGGEVTVAQLAPYTFGENGWTTLVFVNGRHDADLSSGLELSTGVRVLPLAEAREEMGDLVEGTLGSICTVEQSAFVALNAALHTDGAVVHLAPTPRRGRRFTCCSSRTHSRPRVPRIRASSSSPSRTRRRP
jgi:Fe-S cluster assembly protein SufD